MTATPRHDALRERILVVPIGMRTDILLEEYAKLEREAADLREGAAMNRDALLREAIGELQHPIDCQQRMHENWGCNCLISRITAALEDKSIPDAVARVATADPDGKVTEWMQFKPLSAGDRLYVAALSAESGGWIPVAKRLPEKNTWNLVCYEGGRLPIGNMSHWFDGERFRDISSWPVTHWQPLPPPPKGE